MRADFGGFFPKMIDGTWGARGKLRPDQVEKWESLGRAPRIQVKTRAGKTWVTAVMAVANCEEKESGNFVIDVYTENGPSKTKVRRQNRRPDNRRVSYDRTCPTCGATIHMDDSRCWECGL